MVRIVCPARHCTDWCTHPQPASFTTCAKSRIILTWRRRCKILRSIAMQSGYSESWSHHIFRWQINPLVQLLPWHVAASLLFHPRLAFSRIQVAFCCCYIFKCQSSEICFFTTFNAIVAIQQLQIGFLKIMNASSNDGLMFNLQSIVAGNNDDTVINHSRSSLGIE